MARRRYQRGHVFIRGSVNPVWVARWREDVIDSEGNRRRKLVSQPLAAVRDCPRKKQVLRLLEEKLREVNNPFRQPTNEITFVQFVEKWKKTVLESQRYKPSTRPSYRGHLDKWLIPYFGKVELSQINREELDRFVGWLPRSPNTVRRVIATFRAVWRSARAWGYVKEDPFIDLELPKPNGGNGHAKLSYEEAIRVIQAAPQPFKTFLWLALETGLRVGEICGLEVGDVDLENSMLLVRQSVWNGRIQSPKSASSVRKVPISGELSHCLSALVEGKEKPSLERNPIQRSVQSPSPQLLFSSRKNTPWNSRNLLRRKLHPLLKSLGLPQCGFHAFRHANATEMGHQGVPLKAMQTRLGHSDSRLTLQVYTHSVGKDEREAAEMLGRGIKTALDFVPNCSQPEPSDSVSN